MSKQFYFKKFSLALVHSLVLVEPEIGPDQVLPIWTRVKLGAMANCAPHNQNIAKLLTHPNKNILGHGHWNKNIKDT